MEGEKLAEEVNTNDHEGSSSSSSKNPLLIVLVLVNTLAVLGIGFFQFQNHKKITEIKSLGEIMQEQIASEAAKAAQAEGGTVAAADSAKLNEGLMYPIDPFTANLAQGDGPKRYIRISMVLKFSKDTAKDEVDARKPQISDAIISMLNAKKPEELLRVEGKEYLKEEIKTAINNFMIDGHLQDIYYVGFQIN